MRRALSRRAPGSVGLLDSREGAAQGQFREHCFSKYYQELFTKNNTGVEVNHVELVTGKGSSKVVCTLTGLFSRGRRLESDLVGPY